MVLTATSARFLTDPAPGDQGFNTLQVPFPNAPPVIWVVSHLNDQKGTVNGFGHVRQYAAENLRIGLLQTQVIA